EEHRPSRSGIDEEGDKKHDAMQNMASRPQSLHDYLSDQAGFLDVSPRLAAMVQLLIGYLDNKGRLSTPLEEIAKSTEPMIPLEELEEALQLVQKFDPPGVGARSVEESLLLQLTPETPHREIVRVLIQHHLDDIVHNRLPVIQRKTGFDLATIKEAIEVLKPLNLSPGAQFASENIPYVVPDIVVERNDAGDSEVRLLDA